MTLSTSDFRKFHAVVHEGKEPFAWQERLLERVVRDKTWPRVLDLPTGCGKTTCIDVALFALALDAQNESGQRWCPRRIAMVVDRRIVVDQAAERGRKLLAALTTSSEGVVIQVAALLRSLTSVNEEPLGVFTLRGGIPKDDGWARRPDQPLVIASTVDQVGSRMFVQGYGVSSSMAPVHAGLLANDTLLLLDEVHLSEPFRQTLNQLERLRERFSNSGVKCRFVHAFLSATPGSTDSSTFSLLDDEKRLDSPLGRRLHARKPVRLAEVDDRSELHDVCVAQAMDLLERHRTVGVVVNRVTSASAIAERLSVSLAGDSSVTLLTGRMRPLDRDDVLRELRPLVQAGRDRRTDSVKQVVVGTQCIEAGADFDFDAIVTEAASLDALRQRFGRVDRLGEYGSAEGVIVYDRSSKDDPVYGGALAQTMLWLKQQQKERGRKLKDDVKRLKADAKKLRGEARAEADRRIAQADQVDFGVLAVTVPVGEEASKLLAPKADAPTLLPAYLDLWVQTSPPPSQVPDVSLWLHGPSAGPADVQVIWRADLTNKILAEGGDEAATGIVSAVRPSSLEAVSLPFATVRAWLAKLPQPDLGDTEGVPSADLDEPDTAGRRALCWRGDKSEVIDAGSLRPGQTIVVPASYGGIRKGCFDAGASQPTSDCAEQAALLGRAYPVLRLHPLVLANLGLAPSLEEPDEARRELDRQATNESWPAWKRLWAHSLSTGRGSFVVPGDCPCTVLVAKRVTFEALRSTLHPGDALEDGVELTTEGEESSSGGRVVTLAQHTANVEKMSREFAMRCGLGVWLAEHIALAAWLHDIGKADRRFQLMLRGGSEIELFKDETPLAKSAMASGARAQRRLARLRSGYPEGGAFHAVQSVAMMQSQLLMLRDRLLEAGCQGEPDLDLVLHLVASHHGDCRPFAPGLIDGRSIDVALDGHWSERFGRLDFPAIPSNNALHRLDSPLADRFWALVGKYGWQELCWLEGMLRLADHCASAQEQEG